MKAKLMIATIGLIFLSSCSAWLSGSAKEERQTSSLVKYLYSDGHSQQHTPEAPLLKLPVKVGIAFIPSKDTNHGGIHVKDEIELLEVVKESFIKYDYIDRIEVIPSIYLANGQGFTTLEQLSRLHDVDIMALVSYDQVSRSSLNPTSLLYWTIVGAYIVPGNSNLTQTFVDTAVFDVTTRKLLFRAPGTDKIKSYANAITVSNDARVKSNKSYHNAVVDMITNLDLELSRFKTRVKEEKIARVEVRKGYSGGSPGLVLLLLLALLLTVRLSRTRSANS
ncbi:MAG: rhombotarget lipoprotein [Gammaproteobacteria bacterium]|nr:rhombotarget lipoprotein [Gammaproteobacteria bacterium]